MLCLTGAETDLDALLRRIDAHPGELHEVRLDCLAGSEQALHRISSPHRRILWTLRSVSQGGRFAGACDEYERRVAALLDLQDGLVDLEFDDAPHVRRLAARDAGRVVLSWHGRAPLSRLEATARAMADTKVAIRKMAIHVDDAADLGLLLRCSRLLPRPFVVLALGAAGKASRILYERFGSAWCFASAGGDVPGAPGLLSLDEARAAIPSSGAARPLALLGGEQVSRSPGLTVYPRVFRARGLPFSYVAWPTHRLADSLLVLEQLGFRGASVTMPHKQDALRHCVRVDELARRAGAVNTLVREHDGWAGSNTDVVAVREAIGAAGGAPCHRAAVLGTGGAARAAIVALDQLGMSVVAFGRAPAEARALCDLGRAVSVHPWHDLDSAAFDVIVNATPLGADGRSCPLDPHSSLQGRVVMDMIHTPEETPLVAMARARGARTITGRAMWVLQAVAQMRCCIGVDLDAAELARAWPAEDSLP